MNRSTLVLVIVLTALGAVTYFLLPSEKERSASEEPPKVSLAVDSATVVKIALQRTTNSVFLENIGGRWMLTKPINAPADPAAVAQLVGKFAAFKPGSIISSNPEKQRIFQVDSAGTLLTMTDRSGKSVSVILGKIGPSYSEIFFRIPDEKEVYLGEGLESWIVSREPNEWRDKGILSLHTDAVKELTYAVSGKEYRLVRDSSGWKMGGQSVNPGTVTSALNALTNLRADGFDDSLTAIPGRPVTVGIRTSEHLTLTLAPADTTRYYAQISSSKQVFIVSKWTAQQLLKPIETHVSAEKSAPSRAAGLPPSHEPKSPAKTVAETKKQPVPPVSKQPAEHGPTAGTKTETSGPVPFVPPKKLVKSKKGPAVQQTPERPEPKTEQIPAERTTPPAVKEAPPAMKETPPAVRETPPAGKEQPVKTPPAAQPSVNTTPPPSAVPGGDEEGELMVHTVKKGETMPMIAKKYNISVDMILKWNLLKSIVVKPGQELYIYIKK